MDEIDGIYNCNGLKYGTYKIFDTFRFINIDGDQNIKQNKIPLRTKFFLSLMVHLKFFEPHYKLLYFKILLIISTSILNYYNQGYY
jgi:hypothetical protein